MRTRRFGALTACLLTGLIPSGVEAQEPQFTYTLFKMPVSIDLDVSQIAALGESSPPVIQRGIEEFPSEPLTGDWSLVDVSGSPSGGDIGAVTALIDSLAAEPGNTTYIGAVFTDPETNVSMITGPTVNVGFNPGVPMETVLADLQSVGLGAILESDWLGWDNTFRVEGNSLSGLTVLDRANAIAQLGTVEWASVSWIFFGDLVLDDVGDPVPMPSIVRRHSPYGPNAPKAAGLCAPLTGPVLDEFFDFSWHLEQDPGIDTNVLSAWQTCGGTVDIVVAVCDDGVQPDHPDLPNQVPGVDVTDDCASPPCPGGQPKAACDIHGTGVAGVISGAANLIGTRGLAPNASIMSIRVGKYTTNSSPETHCFAIGSQEALAIGVMHAVNSGVKIINLSWNYGVGTIMPELVKAFEAAAAAGVITFNSAGNQGDPVVHVPGNLDTVQAISAFERTGELAREETNGSFTSNTGPNVAFTAPGVGILTTDRTGLDGYGPDDFRSLNGTSCAAPIWAGGAALIRSCRPDLSPRDIVYILCKTAIDLGDPGWDQLFGCGGPDLSAALVMAVPFISADGFESGDFSGWTSVTGASALQNQSQDTRR